MTWQYKVFTVDHFLNSDENLTMEEKLNKYGEEGWELVGMLQKPFSSPGNSPKYLEEDSIVLKKSTED
ncbi:DUF4177 domain-containing protein [Clostridium sp. JS66]|uniref:DUF4177 domain-containing protein n=1 Tax=Clostridium sp. JS66 TaxID=3064705 RepID=UPI00298D61C4|nr:DUF4177 domain-containing protein [Clostridium sp. JS66]WPC39984.1 DUF4177 domain-containing protein [Clostridium sp. JS66]